MYKEILEKIVAKGNQFLDKPLYKLVVGDNYILFDAGELLFKETSFEEKMDLELMYKRLFFAVMKGLLDKVNK